MNDNISETLKVDTTTEGCREARVRWFGNVNGRYQEYVGRKTLEMIPPGRIKTKTAGEMDGLCQPRDDSYRNNRR